MRTTKYLEESDTDSSATPGYCSMGHLANNSPLLRSSSLRVHASPTLTILKRPVQVGSARFQSAALKINKNIEYRQPHSTAQTCELLVL